MSELRTEPATASTEEPSLPTTEQATKAVHSWSLFRTMGRYVAPGSMPSGAMPEVAEASGLRLLDLPRELADHGCPRLGLEDLAQADADECLVVCDQDRRHRIGNRTRTAKPPLGRRPASSRPP